MGKWIGEAKGKVEKTVKLITHRRLKLTTLNLARFLARFWG